MTRTVTKILNLINLKGAHFLVCSLFVVSNMALAATSKIKGFHLKSCVENSCSALVVHGTAEEGFLAPLYAFSSATLTSTNMKTKEARVFHAKEGYYNASHSEIVLRNVKELAGGEMLVDLKTGKINSVK